MLPEIAVSPGFRPSCPETKTKPSAAIACEYGAPWNGAGAASVRTTRLSLIGQPLPNERVEGAWGNREVPPHAAGKRGAVGETGFPPRERAAGERRSRTCLR